MLQEPVEEQHRDQEATSEERLRELLGLVSELKNSWQESIAVAKNHAEKVASYEAKFYDVKIQLQAAFTAFWQELNA